MDEIFENPNMVKENAVDIVSITICIFQNIFIVFFNIIKLISYLYIILQTIVPHTENISLYIITFL